LTPAKSHLLDPAKQGLTVKVQHRFDIEINLSRSNFEVNPLCRAPLVDEPAVSNNLVGKKG